MALPTPRSIARALRDPSNHELVVAVRHKFLDRVEPFVDESPSDTDGRIMLAYKTVKELFKTIPKAVIVEQLKFWYVDAKHKERYWILPQLWLKQANKPAVEEIGERLGSILQSLSPIIMVPAVAAVLGDLGSLTNANRPEFVYVGRDERTRTFAEHLRFIFWVVFTPDKNSSCIHELKSIPWCTNVMEVRRWVLEGLQLAGHRANYDVEELLSRFDEEFYWDRCKANEQRLLSMDKQARAQKIMTFLLDALMDTFEDFSARQMEKVAECLWGKLPPQAISKWHKRDKDAAFLVTFFGLLPAAISKSVIGCGEFVHYDSHYHADVDSNVVAVGTIARKPEAIAVLFDLLKEVDPKLVKGWNGMQIRDELPLVE